MTKEIKRTAFDRRQHAGVVQHLDREGWYWPKHFGDPVAEHHAIRNDVGVWDVSPLRKVVLSGPDAMKAVDRIFANDMQSLEVGQVRYTPFCDESGKLVGECTVPRMGATGAWRSRRSTPTSTTSRPWPTGSRSRSSDDEVDPAARDQRPPLARAAPGPHRRRRRGAPLLPLLARAGEGRRGSVLGVAHRLLGRARVRAVLLARGGRSSSGTVVAGGARPCGLAAVETIRIESGLLFFGRDYFQHETSPYDVGLDKLVRLDKAEFPRQALAAEAASAQPVRHPRRGRTGPDYGAAVTKNGERVGTLTSPCASPTLGKVIGLTVLSADVARDGETVEVAVENGSVPATVAPVPLRHRQEAREPSEIAPGSDVRCAPFA